MIEVTVIRDSVSDHGVRLVTMKLRFHRFILAEFNTHRVFSRNASSSRAVPTSKLIEEVRSTALRAAPVSWGQNQKGMRAGGELTGDTLRSVQSAWISAAFDAAYWAERMAAAGAHKQVCNRILEPFTHINVVVTATEWMNFFGLRLDKAAQPEMRALAEAMWRAFNESVPSPLKQGGWHLPFVDDVTSDLVTADCIAEHAETGQTPDPWSLSIKVSVARCARVSYESHETGKRSTLEADIKLHDFLLASRHLSPFEHQATPDERSINYVATGNGAGWMRPFEHGNLRGWIQRRKQIPGETIASLPEGYS